MLRHMIKADVDGCGGIFAPLGFGPDAAEAAGPGLGLGWIALSEDSPIVWLLFFFLAMVKNAVRMGDFSYSKTIEVSWFNSPMAGLVAKYLGLFRASSRQVD